MMFHGTWTRTLADGEVENDVLAAEATDVREDRLPGVPDEHDVDARVGRLRESERRVGSKVEEDLGGVPVHA
jgi:hypothetical protein